MRKAYAVLAWIIAGAVVVQAAAIAFGLSGLISWVQDGGVLDKAVLESGEVSFAGVLGFVVHSLNGQFLIPLVTLALLGVSFGVRGRRPRVLAAVLVVLVAAQVTLGLTAPAAPYLGILHGANALAILLVAVAAARLVRPARAPAGAATTGVPAAGSAPRAEQPRGT
ncbi:hypothetical protein [Puerhibacterium puerhi]|uniref:hypothetical protein n=1 Tax=Puerhibacterium puerhi TaxID=2692623 RepID=UPI00135A6ED0|nr:hypothetical protein [Puerhibacterium puerhi]